MPRLQSVQSPDQLYLGVLGIDWIGWWHIQRIRSRIGAEALKP